MYAPFFQNSDLSALLPAPQVFAIVTRKQPRKAKPATKPPRTVADVVLAVRPSSSDKDHYQGTPVNLDTDRGPLPPPPRGMYRNIAYF
ncbi:hypothetical protein COOONC_18804 [Cooperia oncophora]